MFAAITMSAVLVLGTIILHFTALRILALRMNDEVRVFKRPLVAVLLVLFATHLVEVLLYALGFLALEVLGVGHLATIDAAVAVPFDDFFYFSIACYTTLGIGDIVPLRVRLPRVNLRPAPQLSSTQHTRLLMTRHRCIHNAPARQSSLGTRCHM